MLALHFYGDSTKAKEAADASPLPLSFSSFLLLPFYSLVALLLLPALSL
jgi:hypothetical protein